MKTVLGSIHVVEQLLFSLFPSILTLDFDLFLGCFLLFGTLMGYVWVQCWVQKLFWGLLTKKRKHPQLLPLPTCELHPLAEAPVVYPFLNSLHLSESLTQAGTERSRQSPPPNLLHLKR